MQNTPGRKGLSRLLHRSVADYLARHTPCRVPALRCYSTKQVYQYTNVANKTMGSQNAALSFALAAGNTNPQDIADPPAGDMLPSSASGSVPTNLPVSTPPSALDLHNVPAVAAIPVLNGHDAMWAMLGGEILKRANEPSFNQDGKASHLSAADRAFVLRDAFDLANTIEGRRSLTPVFIDGAGADPAADGLLNGALPVQEIEGSATATDVFFVLLADPLMTGE
jgi:hypothetical protein